MNHVQSFYFFLFDCQKNLIINFLIFNFVVNFIKLLFLIIPIVVNHIQSFYFFHLDSQTNLTFNFSNIHVVINFVVHFANLRILIFNNSLQSF